MIFQLQLEMQDQPPGDQVGTLIKKCYTKMEYFKIEKTYIDQQMQRQNRLVAHLC